MIMMLVLDCSDLVLCHLNVSIDIIYIELV